MHYLPKKIQLAKKMEQELGFSKILLKKMSKKSQKIIL